MNNQDDQPRILPGGDDIQEEVTDYSHVTKHAYTTKLFCWIQSGQTKKVISFFNTFPHLINEFYTPNNWSPFMYAVRYGNMELIQYFSQSKMRINVNSIFNHVSMVHAAVYSSDIKILKYVLNTMKLTTNPSNCETSPLKIAMKIGNARMVQVLICKGAYYVFGDVLNNIQLKQFGDQNSKYISLQTGKQLNNNSVVEDSTVKDCPVKQILRWARVRQLMHLQKQAVSYKQSGIQGKFEPLAKILTNENYFNSIMRACIGKGDSIINKSQVIESQRSQQSKQSKQSSKK